MPSKVLVWFGAVVLVFGAIAAWELSHFKLPDATLPGVPSYSVTLDGTAISVMIADTPQKQAQGLRGTPSLPLDGGMLFVFPQDGIYSFWMKDMNYPLDILWLADDGSIMYMQQNLSPSTYPQTYAPRVSAHYVLEVNAGFVAQHQIQLGDIVHFQ